MYAGVVWFRSGKRQTVATGVEIGHTFTNLGHTSTNLGHNSTNLGHNSTNLGHTFTNLGHTSTNLGLTLSLNQVSVQNVGYKRSNSSDSELHIDPAG